MYIENVVMNILPGNNGTAVAGINIGTVWFLPRTALKKHNVACSGHVPLQEIIWESLSEPHTSESNSAPTCMYVLLGAHI